MGSWVGAAAHGRPVKNFRAAAVRAAVIAVVAAVALSGCSSGSSTEGNAEQVASDGIMIMKTFGIATEAADGLVKYTVERAAEVDCQGHKIAAPPEETKWQVRARGPVADKAAGDKAVDLSRDALLAEGWSIEYEGVLPPDKHGASGRSVTMVKDGAFASIEIPRPFVKDGSTEAPQYEVAFGSNSECLKQAEGHLMSKDPLDPDYKFPSSYYR